MKLSPFIFLAIFCIFSISIVSGAEISIVDLHDVSHGIAPSGYIGDADQIMLVASDNDVISTDIFGSGMSVNSILNFPADVSGVYNTKSWIYVVLTDGRAYKIPSSPYQREFGNLNFADVDHKDGYYLGDFSTATSYPKIAVDVMGDIYIYTPAEAKIIKVDGSTLTSTDYISSADFNTMTTNANNKARASFVIYDNSIYIAIADNGFDLDVYRFTAPGAGTKIYDNVLLNTETSAAYLAPLSNGNWILGLSNHVTPYTQIIEYNGSASIGTIYSSGGYTNLQTDKGSLIVKPNGIICFAAENVDKIVTFTTISGAGGIYTEEEGTTPKEITYSFLNVNSEYNSYYNMSNVNVKWSIAIDKDFINTWTNTHSTPIQDTYRWRIELFSPDDVFVSSYDVPKTSWKYQKYTLGIFGSGDYISSGYVGFSNIRGNGTWYVKLYEINSVTGAKAFLDSGSFRILDQSNPTGAGTVPTDKDTTGLISNFLESPYIIAIIIIGVVGFQFGRGRDGNINGSAMVVLIPLAVGLCVLMGLLPMWILYTMVLCIIAFIAMKLSSGGS